MSVLDLVKSAGQDFEWYPTTDKMLKKICDHYKKESSRHCWEVRKVKMLDIGAGDGRVLSYFRDQDIANSENLYAIEASDLLRASMDESIFTVGTDFFEQSLWDKSADITFCNPPYSNFGRWVAKIIRESISPTIYLVIPQRWRKNKEIQDAIRDRGNFLRTEVVGSFDFLDAERSARAKVDIVCIDNSRMRNEADPFETFFDTYFSKVADKFDDSAIPEPDKEAAKKEFKDSQSKLVGGKNMVERLVTGYQDEQKRIITAYEKVGDIDRMILDELEINKDKLVSMLRDKIIGLKKKYWILLFENFEPLTSRLTSKTRKQMMMKLNSETSVDFTASNAYSVIVWAVKQVNKYVDEQLIDVFEGLVGADSVCAYKSNKRLFVDNHWRYCGDDEKRATHFSLNYRIVSERAGGLATGFIYGREQNTNLSDRAYDNVSDILTVANNLGFRVESGQTPNRVWGNKAEFFHTTDGDELLKVRAFKNQNMHLFFNKDFMLALNVEYGRLKGWLNSPDNAAQELKEPKAVKAFDTNLKLGQSSLPLLTGS